MTMFRTDRFSGKSSFKNPHPFLISTDDAVVGPRSAVPTDYGFIP
jgi:hypothetical protein